MEGKLFYRRPYIKPKIKQFFFPFSIAPTFGSLERDVRFIYCACSISYILNDWSGINIDRTVEHIRQLQVRKILN
jgi:hypothetical protein